MSIKIVAIDLDGTLLTSNKTISETTVKTIKQAKQAGVKIVLATGRPLTGVVAFLDQLALNDPGDYAITYNGALVQSTADNQVLVQHDLNYQDYLEIEYMARKIGVHAHAEDADFIYTTNRDLSPYTIGESTLVSMQVRYRTPDEFSPDKTFVKVMMVDEPAILAAAIDRIPVAFSEKFHLVRSEPYFLEVLNQNASKGNALTDLANQLNIPLSDVMAIGDQENDASMLKIAGTSVAMGNAIPAIKTLADFTTDTNDQDGVAKAIQEYAL